MEETQTAERKPSRWRLWLGGALFILGAAEKIIGWGGSLDFVISRWSDPGWVGTALRFTAVNSYYFSFVLMIVGLAFIIWNERRRTDTLYGPLKESWENAPDFAATFEEAAAPTPSGDTLVATGTVRDPTTEEILKRGLYTGQIYLSADRLKKDHVLELTVRAFNGAHRITRIADVGGCIVASVPDQKGVKKQHELPTPTLIRQDGSAHSHAKFSEFHVSLHQHLTPAQARAIGRALTNEAVSFDLRKLDVWVADINEPATRVRLPLWDGVTLRPASGLQA